MTRRILSLMLFIFFTFTACRFSPTIPSTKKRIASEDSTPSPTATLSISDGPTYAFGNVTVGNATNKAFTVTNSGNGTATFLSSSLTGSDLVYLGGSYPGTGGTCSTSLSAAESCTVMIRFVPQSSGNKSDRLTISYGSGVITTSTSVALTGTGLTVASLSISDGATYDYGNAVVASNSDHTFTVTNSGETTATSMISNGFSPGTQYCFLGGTYPGGGTCNTSLGGSNSTCTIAVRFTPTSTGVKNDTIEIGYHNGATTTSATRAVTGTGTALSSGPSGSLDTSFSTDGKWTAVLSTDDFIYGIASFSNDDLVIAGNESATSNLVAKVKANGQLDTSFATDGTWIGQINGIPTRSAWDILIQTDGKIVFADSDAASAGADTVRVIRMSSDSSLDTTYNTNGYSASFDVAGIPAFGAKLALQTDGKVLTHTSASAAAHDFLLTRLTTDGRLDTAFATTGKKQYSPSGVGGANDSEVGRVRVATDGTIAATGWADYTVGGVGFHVEKLKSDGSLDTSFGTDGGFMSQVGNDKTYSLGIDSSGKALLVGENSHYRISASGDSLDTSFHTDGKAAAYGLSLKDGLVQSTDRLIAVGATASGGSSLGMSRHSTNGSLDTSFHTNGTFEITYTGNDGIKAIIERPTTGSLCMASFDAAGASQTQITCIYP